MELPLAFHSPLLTPLCSPFCSFLLTWNPPCCNRIRPPWSQVAHKLTSPSSTPFSFPPHSKFPVPRLFMPPTVMTSRLRLLLSGTVPADLIQQNMGYFDTQSKIRGLGGGGGTVVHENVWCKKFRETVPFKDFKLTLWPSNSHKWHSSAPLDNQCSMTLNAMH